MVCILVSGMPASGKSTMAAYLSRALGMPAFSKDVIKERLYDSVGFRSRAEKVQLGVAAMHILYDCARACLSCGQSVILENNFEYASREGLAALLADCPCRVIVVHMTGDLRALYARFATRDQSPARHRGHVVNDCYPEMPGQTQTHATPSFDAFAASVASRGMDQQPCDAPCIRVDTTDPECVDCAAVAAQLRAMLG